MRVLQPWISHSHSSFCLVLPWAMRIHRASFCFGKTPVADYFFAPFSWMATAGFVWRPYPFIPHERRYQRKVLPSSRGAQCSPWHFNSFPLAVIIKTQILNLACKALRDLAPAFFSSSPRTTLTPITAPKLTGFCSISLMSQGPFGFSAFAHVVPSA